MMLNIWSILFIICGVVVGFGLGLMYLKIELSIKTANKFKRLDKKFSDTVKDWADEKVKKNQTIKKLERKIIRLSKSSKLKVKK